MESNFEKIKSFIKIIRPQKQWQLNLKNLNKFKPKSQIQNNDKQNNNDCQNNDESSNSNMYENQ